MAETIPRPSLLGIPPELRLIIYGYLNKPVVYHIDDLRDNDLDSGKLTLEHKRVCRAPDAEHTLCSRPIFAGSHHPGELCHTLPGREDAGLVEHRPTFRQTCKLIFSETVDLFDGGSMGIICPSWGRIWDWQPLKTPPLEKIADLTVQLLPAKHAKLFIADFVRDLKANTFSLPNLKKLALQGPRSYRRYCIKRKNERRIFDPQQTWRKAWWLDSLRIAFNGRVMVIDEGWVLVQGTNTRFGKGKDELLRIRGTIERSIPGAPEQTSFEMTRHEVLGPGPWMIQWTPRDLGPLRYVGKSSLIHPSSSGARIAPLL